MNALEKLAQLRASGGKRLTNGLDSDTISRFAEHDPALTQAIDMAWDTFQRIKVDYPALIDMDEADQLSEIQRDFVNFYADDAVNPYVSLAAKGPWLITLKGAVLHDNGGYGMLGMGHAPDSVIEAMSRPHVMANVMTPNIHQKRLTDALRKEIGHTRGHCPFDRFLCLNSGSEAVTVAARISDINAKNMTDPEGRHAGKPVKIMSLQGAFHGRTDRPAQFSDSSLKTYREYCASFRDRDNLITVPANDTDALRRAFAEAESQGVFIEALFMEPVMGEGNPGQAITPAFYRMARELTAAHGSLFLVDSIQAGLRATGNLSIVDYPGFENEEAPDMETYSKALNAGQYPLSVLAMNKKAANLYVKGVYGNTMTTNPRAMDVAVTVLESLNDEIRQNIRDRGEEFISRLNALKDRLNGEITGVQGTGLLFSCELSPAFKAYGKGSIEEYLRLHGLGVIHGGENSLRFTPHFAITSTEVDLIVSAVEDAINNGPRIALNKAS